MLSERVLIGGALALLLNVLAILLLVYLSGPVPRGLQLALHFSLFLLPFVLSGRGSPSSPHTRIPWGILLVLAVVLTTRLPNLGYSEFQGDEGVVMVRAAAIIAGDDAELFLHQKGPAEILLPLGLWNLAQTTNEFWARLPFVWANGLAILAVVCLARRWFGLGEALLAGLMFALVGFTVAFGRIVQYQSLVMLWGIGAVFAAIRYDEEEKALDLFLSAVFLASALLAHYDAVLVAPAIGWILVRRLSRRRRLDLRLWAASLGSAAIVLVAFYLPYFLNPNSVRTGKYLLQARLGAGDGSGLLSWSGPEVWQMLTFYNSTYFIVGLAALALVAFWKLRQYRFPIDAALYFLVPMLFYLFIVEDPRTHVYTIAGGGSILAAVGAAHLGVWIKRTRNRLVFGGSFIAFLLFLFVSGYYDYLIFIDHTPERQRTWAKNRPAGYVTTWEEPPLYGLFGFPHRAGWSAVVELLPESVYPYASNEEEEITNWYMLQAPRTHCANFGAFILADSVQDEIPYESVWLDPHVLQYRILVDGRPSIQIYGQGPEDSVRVIDGSNRVLWVSPLTVAPPLESGDHPIHVILGEDDVKLLGYDLDTTNSRPGGQVVVTLYWQALAPFERNYQTFVHLTGDDSMTQHDGSPECGINPTTRWEPGQVIPDPHIVPIPADVGGADFALYAGMYDLLTLLPLSPPNESDHRIWLADLSLEDDAR